MQSSEMTINNQFLKSSTGVCTFSQYFYDYISCIFPNVGKTEGMHFQVSQNWLIPMGNGHNQKNKKLPDVVSI